MPHCRENIHWSHVGLVCLTASEAPAPQGVRYTWWKRTPSKPPPAPGSHSLVCFRYSYLPPSTQVFGVLIYLYPRVPLRIGRKPTPEKPILLQRASVEGVAGIYRNFEEVFVVNVLAGSRLGIMTNGT